MTEPLISVIIPFYKGEKYIEQAVGSVLRQPYRNIELLLINDGSPTGSRECLKIKDSDNRIRYYANHHEGIGATRNFGIEHASGDYLVFLDQDDVWVKGFLTYETVEQIAGKGDIVAFSYYTCNDALSRGTLERVRNETVKGGGMAGLACANHHSSLFVPRSLIINPDIRYAHSRMEDAFFKLRALYAAEHITYIDKVMFLHRNNPRSETHRKISPESLYGPILQSWEELLRWHEDKHPEDTETIKGVKHMICVYAMEGVEALYQNGYSEAEAETIIDENFCRYYLDHYKDMVLSDNRLKQIGEYYDNRETFIRKQRRTGARRRFKNCLKALYICRRINDFVKFKEILDENLIAGNNTNTSA